MSTSVPEALPLGVPLGVFGLLWGWLIKETKDYFADWKRRRNEPPDALTSTYAHVFSRLLA
jgi:hypothetical protein